MAHNVTLIPGDSVGRELAPMTQRVIAAAGVDVDWDVVEAAQDDLADRRAFALDDAAWVELQDLLDRPPVVKPELAELLSNPSVLEHDA